MDGFPPWPRESTLSPGFTCPTDAVPEAAAYAMDGMPEGTPPGALSESEIFAQARKRKEAAIAELTRLELRVQCVADAYLCASLLDRNNQLHAAVAGAENEARSPPHFLARTHFLLLRDCLRLSRCR